MLAATAEAKLQAAQEAALVQEHALFRQKEQLLADFEKQKTALIAEALQVGNSCWWPQSAACLLARSQPVALCPATLCLGSPQAASSLPSQPAPHLSSAFSTSLRSHSRARVCHPSLTGRGRDARCQGVAGRLSRCAPLLFH